MAAGRGRYVERVKQNSLSPGVRTATPAAATMGGMEWRCPSCGSARVIPLTFPPGAGIGLAELPERPLAKCAECGYRLTAGEIEAQEGPSRN